MKFLSQIIFFFLCQTSLAQQVNPFLAIDKKMDEIPLEKTISTTEIANYITSNFKSESEKVRAVFYWTASNISYDVVNMNEPNFVYSSEEKIANALKNKTGVCIHYAEVFNEIANKIGLKTYIIHGYTKQNGVIASTSHAWNACRIDGKWFLFDPTWGSGYVHNEKFYKKLNNNYFKVLPSKMIQSHMPFDYLWQFLSNPITNGEFYSGKVSNERWISNYDFEKEIAIYEKLSTEEKAFEASKRMEKIVILPGLINDYFLYKKEEFTVLRQNKNVEKFNNIVAEYNEAISAMNDFILYRNKKFKPAFSDDIISDMIKTPYEKLKKCQTEINNLGSMGKENQSGLNKLLMEVSQNVKTAEEHYKFVEDYLSKNKVGRKLMFTKLK